MGSDSSAIDAAIAANATIAAFQPKPLMSDWPTGASTIVPSDPAAATRPTVWLRFSGGVARDTVPMRTPKPVPAVPMAAREPATPGPPGKAVQNNINRNPPADTTAGAASTGRVPERSAAPPAQGLDRPP